MGQKEKRPGAGNPVGAGHGSARNSAWQDDGLFDSAPPMRLPWDAEARLLLRDVLEKLPPRVRITAERQAEEQIESLARARGAQQIDAEMVGLALGGMSAPPEDE